MEGHKGDFEATLTEVIKDRRVGATTYTHIECKVGGTERVAMACRALSGCLTDNADDLVTYVFVNKADYRVALMSTGIDPARVYTRRRTNKILMTTYAEWMQWERRAINSKGCLTILMDMGFGTRTTEMAAATMGMLHDMQGLLRGDRTDKTISWVSVSYSSQALLSEKRGRRVRGLTMPEFGRQRICNRDRAHEEIQDQQMPDGNWQKDAVSRFAKDHIGGKVGEASNITLALVTPVKDAYRIRNELSVKWLRPVPIHFIQPWTDRDDIERAVGDSDGVKIVSIDPQVSIIPPISNLKAVILAPVFDWYAFDINITGVVGRKVVLDTATALAFSVRGEGPVKPGSVEVYHSHGPALPGTTANGDLVAPERQAELSTVSNVGFMYSHLYAGVVAGSYPYPGILSVITPPSSPEVAEAERRLNVWRMTGRAEAQGKGPRLQLMAPLGTAMQGLLDSESNMHSLVLLGSITPGMPLRVKQVLLDLATLVSQGISSIFDPGTAVAEYDHIGILRGLSTNTGFARNHCHKGQVWQSLAYLHLFRKLSTEATWGTQETSVKALGGAVRTDMLGMANRRVAQWKKFLNVPGADEADALSDQEFRTVENILVAAFAFNLMMVHVEEVGYFGRAVTSEVILEKEADGESVAWDVLKEKAKKDGEQHMMAIYDHLHRDVIKDEHDLPVYRAVGTTMVSTYAFCEGLLDLGIEHYNALRPPYRSERRCLIPRGTSWSPRLSGSSQGSSSFSDAPV